MFVSVINFLFIIALLMFIDYGIRRNCFIKLQNSDRKYEFLVKWN